MFALYKKEIQSFFSNLVGPLVMAVFLLLTGAFLWLIPSEYNILDGGYASVDGLFALAPWLYLFLIPAVTMRSFSEELKTGTIECLQTKPISRLTIVGAKYAACFTLAVLALLPTLIYALSVCFLGIEFANMDMGGFWGAFIGLILLAAVYTAIGVFTSSYTDNPVISFVLSAFLCFLFYDGFEWLSALSSSGIIQDSIAQLGIAHHYQSISRGVVDFRDLLYFIVVSALFVLFSFQVQFKWSQLAYVLAGLVLIVVSHVVVWRWDLTSENRYTLSSQTKELLRSQKEPLKVTVYLDGDLNRGFLRLQKSTCELLEEMSNYAGEGLSIELENPAEASSEKARNERYLALENAGLKPTVVYDQDGEGKMEQKVIFPWAVVALGKDSVRQIPVPLLTNISGRSGEENLNSSIENLEYELTDALRILSAQSYHKIAFLEGHGEYAEPYVFDITSQLARYYQVDRGILGSNIAMLDDYKVVIVAGPSQAFSESDKFVLDQYLMQGGRILWLLDGVSTNGEVGIVNETNLQDMLFTYGIRINPMLVLDTQCALVPINTAARGEEPVFKPFPWYYSPLLLPSPKNGITRNIAPVQAEFASYIELVGEEQNAGITKTILLATSAHTALEKAPMNLSAQIINLPPDSPYFAYGYLPVAALFTGQFSSVFAHRMPPENMEMQGRKIQEKSISTKMIVVADGSIIANDLQGFGEGVEALPLGYDSYMNKQFGNAQFVLNSINYLADDAAWLELRNRELPVRLLDKQKVATQRVLWQSINLGLPLVLLITFTAVYQAVRRRRFAKHY